MGLSHIQYIFYLLCKYFQFIIVGWYLTLRNCAKFVDIKSFVFLIRISKDLFQKGI